jgi:hypothetical protein
MEVSNDGILVMHEEQDVFSLDKESVDIINKMTGNPFGINGSLWLYWLFKLELIPGGWVATIYLEDNEGKLSPPQSYTGFGSANDAVKRAYAQISKKFLDDGFEQGRLLQESYKTDL